MNIADSRRQLGVSDIDLVVIKRTSNLNRLLLALLGAVTAVAAFMVGVAYTRENPGYPYSSISLAAAAGGSKTKMSWAMALLLAVIAFFFFNFGVLAVHPTSGETSFYGVFSRKT